ncbi:hypothetical protein OO006_11455 [Prosthecochloris sp. SCSIO W1101]|uniref:hypothetical protein n=1 Tax=Prosthecochloris sp. SCSIO W1101 TaxID=2992242 RepID=UPI00223D9ABE|nr:hypothetical protein [Prosthecochloris sp. SCSIO W1101]UZJ40958.1 hypothetical protein OO006_11455 [Prosthecochloris sp. SCSIO W1101]
MDPQVALRLPEDERMRSVMPDVMRHPTPPKSCRTRCGIHGDFQKKMDPRVKPEDDRERGVVPDVMRHPTPPKSCRTRCGIHGDFQKKMDPRVKPEDDRERGVVPDVMRYPCCLWIPGSRFACPRMTGGGASCRTRCGIQPHRSHAALDAASMETFRRRWIPGSSPRMTGREVSCRT